jgi:Nucleotide-diphospho-sugar transferase
MQLYDLLTYDHWLNPISSRLYFSRRRFEKIDLAISKLPVEPLRLALAKTGGALPKGGAGPVLFAVADIGYFKRFANIFVSSAAVSSPQSPVHIHVIGASAKEVQALTPLIGKMPQHFGVTFEAAYLSKLNGALRGRYCQCLRFVRLAQFVKQTQRSHVAFDIDGMFQKSFASFEKDFAADIGLICRLQHDDPGLRVNAGVVFMRSTEAAQSFMDDASGHMLQHLAQAPFIEKLDQRCLALAMEKFPQAVRALDAGLYTFEPGHGYFYSAKGKRKNEILQNEFNRAD